MKMSMLSTTGIVTTLMGWMLASGCATASGDGAGTALDVQSQPDAARSPDSSPAAAQAGNGTRSAPPGQVSKAGGSTGASLQQDATGEPEAAASGHLSAAERRARLRTRLSDLQPALEEPAGDPTVKELPPRAQRALAEAARLAAQQRFAEATARLERAQRYAPNHPAIHLETARLEDAAGNLVQARIHARKAVDKTPNQVEAQYLLGKVLARLGHADDAIRALRLALLCDDAATKPAVRASVLFELSHVLADAGYMRAAWDARQQSAALPEAALAKADLAAVLQTRLERLFEIDLLQSLGRKEEALRRLSALTEASPGDSALMLHYARMLFEAGRPAQAARAARQASEQPVEAMTLLADYWQQQGKPDHMVEEGEAFLAKEAMTEADLLAVVDMLNARGLAAQGESLLKQFVTGRPEAQAARERYVSLLLNAGRTKETLDVVAASLQQDVAQADRFVRRLDPAQAKRLLGDWQADRSKVGQLYLLGRLHQRAGMAREAERLFRQCLKNEPAFKPARVALAERAFDRFDYEDVLSLAARENADQPESAALEWLLGRSYERLDQPGEAEVHLRAALQLDPTLIEARYLLAEVYAASGKPHLAQQELRTLLQEQPDYEPAADLLVGMYLSSRKLNEALAVLDALIDATSSKLVAGRASALRQQLSDPDFEGYRRKLQALVDESSPDKMLWLAIGESQVEGDRQAAIKAFQRVLTIDSHNERALRGLIRVARSRLDYETVEALWRKLLRMRPNRHEWRLGSGGLFEALSVQEKTDELLQVAEAQLARKDLGEQMAVEYRAAIVTALLADDRQAEAIEALEDYTKINPDATAWRRWLVRVYNFNDQSDKAIPLARALAGPEVGNRAAAELLIETLGQADRHDEAEQVALDWLWRDPESDVGASLLLDAMTTAKRTDDAIQLCKSKIRTSTNPLLFQDRLARVLASDERYDEAIELMEGELSRLERQNRAGVDQLRNAVRASVAELLLAAGEYDEVADRAKVWLSSETEAEAAFRWLLYLGSAQELAGDREAARETKRQALSLQPQSPTLNNDIAYSLIDAGIQLDEAEGMIEQAVAAAPRQSAYLDTYGWLLYKRGDFAGARLWLGRALRLLRGGDGVVTDHLGDACWRLGEKDEAIRRWRHVVETLQGIDARPLRRDEEQSLRNAREKLRIAEQADADATMPLAPLARTEDQNKSGETSADQP